MNRKNWGGPGDIVKVTKEHNTFDEFLDKEFKIRCKKCEQCKSYSLIDTNKIKKWAGCDICLNGCAAPLLRKMFPI